jgi:hypothetical protein
MTIRFPQRAEAEAARKADHARARVSNRAECALLIRHKTAQRPSVLTPFDTYRDMAMALYAEALNDCGKVFAASLFGRHSATYEPCETETRLLADSAFDAVFGGRE